MLDAIAEGAILEVPALWPLEVANALPQSHRCLCRSQRPLENALALCPARADLGRFIACLHRRADVDARPGTADLERRAARTHREGEAADGGAQDRRTGPDRRYLA